MRLLVTRPVADAERTAAALRSRGHAVALAPVLRIEAVKEAAIGAGPWSAILVTSANAAPAIAAHRRFADLRTLPVFAVGKRSAQAMSDMGFAEIISADSDLTDLTRLVADRLQPPAALLYLAGADRSGDLAGALRARGFDVEVAEIYRAVAAATFAAETVAALAEGVDGVLHFSRRSAEAYLNAARAADLTAQALKPGHFCISAPAAEPLAQAGASDIRIAPAPTEAALLALIAPA